MRGAQGGAYVGTLAAQYGAREKSTRPQPMRCWFYLNGKNFLSVDAEHGNYLQQLSRTWSGSDCWAGKRRRLVNDVAFEGYLDQSVPDFH